MKKLVLAVLMTGCGLEWTPIGLPADPPIDSGQVQIQDSGSAITDAGSPVDAGDPCADAGVGVTGQPLVWCPNKQICYDPACLSCCPQGFP